MEAQEAEQGDNLQVFCRTVIYIDIYQFLMPFLCSAAHLQLVQVMSTRNITHPRYASCLPGLDTGGWHGEVRGEKNGIICVHTCSPSGKL